MHAFLHGQRSRRAAVVIAMALSLGACGGGGGGNGNTRPSAPPAAPPAPPPAPPPAAPPPPPIDAQLSLTHADQALAMGLTGQNVTIGVVDTGVMANHPSLQGRVTQELIYVDPSTNNTSIDDVVGHGTWVSEVAAGKPFGQFVGGIAPGANIVSARIIQDKEPTDDGSGQGNRVSAADAQFFGYVNQDLMNAHVNIINNSWGGLYWDASDTVTTQAFDTAYSPFINQYGGLVVFAAGNDSRANPSDTAALPSRAPDLTKGWLVAVALDSNHPTQLASYSNACGVAQNYCLAAPGDVIVSDKDATTTNPNGYWIVSGTSFAAPEVSGAAALVWQRFPYFSNDLVRQTLLGTADDLGAPGPDPVFGYGALDVGRAVEGPARFDWGDVTVNFTGQSIWSNDISGTGGLIKQGSGELDINADGHYTGLTQVQGGTLYANSIASAVQVSNNAAFGAAQVGGDVTSAGYVVLNASQNGAVTTHYSGNYTQTSTGHLVVDLGNQLEVAGQAHIDGQLLVNGTAPGYVENSHTTVLTALGGLSGTFASLSTSSNVPLLTATLHYDPSSAWLDVSQVQVAQVQGLVLTTSSAGAAQRVDGAFGWINGALNGGSGVPPTVNSGFVDGAAKIQQTPNNAALQQSLQSLSGQLHAASAAMTFEAIDAGTQALSDRFDNLLDMPAGGAWTQTLGYHGNMSRSGFNNVGYDLNGWLVGQDFRLGYNGVAGFAVSQARGLGRLAESADQGSSRSVEGMFYGGIVRNDWYAMGRFGVGDYREDMRRNLLLGLTAAPVASDSLGRYEVAYGESGYRFHLGNAMLTPYMNLQYAQIERGSVNELGGYGFGLKSNGQNIQRWQAGLGVRSSQHWSMGQAGELGLQFRFLWQQAFGMRGDVFDASFAALNQWAPVGGIGLSRYGGVAGMTLNWDFSRHSHLAAGYDQHFDQHQLGKTGTLTYSWEF
ncbi:S8 family serine peptidase [Dyella sp.]|uniref:S8 family serine peptidase n=1 Tax=Dyella sp. TaxID=1869338 RepID=UPI002ED4772C